MRSTKAQVFEDLKNKKNSKEYEQWFLRYAPRDAKLKVKRKPRSKKKTYKRSLSIPGSIGKTVKVNRTKLPDTIKANYSITPMKVSRTVKRKKQSNKRTRKKRGRSLFGFKF